MTAQNILKNGNNKFISPHTLRCVILVISSNMLNFAGATNTLPADEPLTSLQKASYSVGYEFGVYMVQLQHQGQALEVETVLQGLRDAASGTQQRLTPEQMRTFLDNLIHPPAPAGTSNPVVKHRQKSLARTGRNMDDYAKLNAKRDGVVVLPSGVQYEVLNQGSGRQPQSNEIVLVNYAGTLSNGVVFDSTFKDGQPASLKLEEIAVPGLREALLQMKVGDKWRVVIPPAMGFANSGSNLLRRRDLIYEIELLAIESDTATTTTATPMK